MSVNNLSALQFPQKLVFVKAFLPEKRKTLIAPWEFQERQANYDHIYHLICSLRLVQTVQTLSSLLHLFWQAGWQLTTIKSFPTLQASVFCLSYLMPSSQGNCSPSLPPQLRRPALQGQISTRSLVGCECTVLSRNKMSPFCCAVCASTISGFCIGWQKHLRESKKVEDWHRK